MKSIQDVSFISRSIDQGESFHEGLTKEISRMQSNGLEVEVQYQQSDNVISAVVLGHKNV